MDILLSYHRHLVEGLILVLILNTILPHLTIKKGFSPMVFYSRVGFFLFWALWSMVTFSGTITLVFSKMDMTPNIWFMLFLSILLPMMDAIRARALHRKYWLKELPGIKFSNIITLAELAFVVIMMLLAI